VRSCCTGRASCVVTTVASRDIGTTKTWWPSQRVSKHALMKPAPTKSISVTIFTSNAWEDTRLIWCLFYPGARRRRGSAAACPSLHTNEGLETKFPSPHSPTWRRLGPVRVDAWQLRRMNLILQPGRAPSCSACRPCPKITMTFKQTTIHRLSSPQRQVSSTKVATSWHRLCPSPRGKIWKSKKFLFL